MFPDPDLTKTDSIALYNRAIYNKNTKNTHSIVHTRDLRPPLLIELWQWMKDVRHLFPISLKMCPPCCHSNFLVGGYDHKALGVENCLSHFLWNSITKLSKFAFLFVRLSSQFRTHAINSSWESQPFRIFRVGTCTGHHHSAVSGLYCK